MPAACSSDAGGANCRAIALSHHGLLSAFPLPTSVVSIAWGLVAHPAPREMLPCSSVWTHGQKHHYPIATHHHYQSPGK